MSQAGAFKTAGASVVLIYPGAAVSVQQYAADFITGKTLPEHFHFVTDPDLKTVNLYGLRWDAPQETAYPSTFVVDTRGVVRFAKISHSHGDRSSAPDVLSILQGLK